MCKGGVRMMGKWLHHHLEECRHSVSQNQKHPHWEVIPCYPPGQSPQSPYDRQGSPEAVEEVVT